MTLLSDIVDISTLDDLIIRGYITRRQSGDGHLAILNYTPAAQWAHLWTQETRACRGLIYEQKSLEVVARPFDKFFNMTQPHTVPDLTGSELICLPKFDGSLGIVYHSGRPSVSTRGSLTSDQALWATTWLGEKWPNWEPPEDITVLVEIIYPQNRIVVNYGDYRGLVCIGARYISTGKLIPPSKLHDLWPGRIAEPILTHFDPHDLSIANPDVATFVESLPKDPQFLEGCVFVCYGVDYMVKVKREEYLKVHRLIYGLTEKVIWECLRDTGDFTDCLVSGLPDDAMGWIVDVGSRMLTQHHAMRFEAEAVLADIVSRVGTDDRKALAQEVTSQPDIDYALLFALLDKNGSQINKYLWGPLKPTHIPFSLGVS